MTVIVSWTSNAFRSDHRRSNMRIARPLLALILTAALPMTGQAAGQAQGQKSTAPFTVGDFAVMLAATTGKGPAPGLTVSRSKAESVLLLLGGTLGPGPAKSAGTTLSDPDLDICLLEKN